MQIFLWYTHKGIKGKLWLTIFVFEEKSLDLVAPVRWKVDYTNFRVHFKI